jgi:hypothetical protein
VDAIPSEPRTPWTRCPGGASFRDVAIIMGPPFRPFRAIGSPRAEGRRTERHETHRIGGTRHAKKASRGVPGARQTAQGRVGSRSRSIALHLESHRLLSATTSAPQGAERLDHFPQKELWQGCAGTVWPLVSRLEAQPLWCSTPLSPGLWAKLVPVGGQANAQPRGPFRGKGVLAV